MNWGEGEGEGGEDMVGALEVGDGVGRFGGDGWMCK